MFPEDELSGRRTTVKRLGFPGATARSLARKGPLKESEPNTICAPAVCVAASNLRTEYDPSNPAYRVVPSLAIANRLGSLPIKTEPVIAPVVGSIVLMLLPPAPTLLGTVA